MGCIEDGDVSVNISIEPVQSICCDERNRSRNQKKNSQCKWTIKLKNLLKNLYSAIACNIFPFPKNL